MEIYSASSFVAETLWLVLKIAGPMLIVGMVVGVVVSLVQAVTQIQEQTLSFVPKITAMILAAILMMPWIETQLREYAVRAFQSLSTLP